MTVTHYGRRTHAVRPRPDHILVVTLNSVNRAACGVVDNADMLRRAVVAPVKEYQIALLRRVA